MVNVVDLTICNVGTSPKFHHILVGSSRQGYETVRAKKQASTKDILCVATLAFLLSLSHF